MIVDLASPRGEVARSLTGPIPPTTQVDIGERFVVWVERDGDTDIGAHDLVNDQRLLITDTSISDERHPATDGPWVVWETPVNGVPSSRIEALNLDTAEHRTVIDDGSIATQPSIHGDIIENANVCLTL